MNYTPNDGFPYYHNLAKGEDLQSMFSKVLTADLLQSIDEEKARYRYKTDKWSIKQIIGHITDHERIKMLRAFQLSRNEKVELWGYDQESLVNNSRFDELSVELLLRDYTNVRRSSESFVAGLSPSQLATMGTARQYNITLEEFLRSVIGHETHHLNVITKRYEL